MHIRISGDVCYPYPYPRPYIYSDPDLYPFLYGCYSYPARDYKCFSNHAYGNCGYNNLRALLFSQFSSGMIYYVYIFLIIICPLRCNSSANYKGRV